MRTILCFLMLLFDYNAIGQTTDSVSYELRYIAFGIFQEKRYTLNGITIYSKGLTYRGGGYYELPLVTSQDLNGNNMDYAYKNGRIRTISCGDKGEGYYGIHSYGLYLVPIKITQTTVDLRLDLIIRIEGISKPKTYTFYYCLSRSTGKMKRIGGATPILITLPIAKRTEFRLYDEWFIASPPPRFRKK